MPAYPFTYNTSELDTGRRYYGGLLAQRRGEPGPWVWSGGGQQVPHETPEQAWGIAKFAFVSSAIAGAGFMPMTWRGQPGRVWDLYVHTMRTMEEYSPAKLLRTFQASNIFSPLETVSRAPRVFTPEIVRQIAESEAEIVGGKLIKPSLRPWLHYLSELSGKDFVGTEVLSKGFHFSEGQLRLGTAVGQGDILLANAAIVRNPNRSARFMEAYARALNFKVPNKLFETAIPFQDGEEMFGFVGGQTPAETASRYGRGITTEMVSRFNRLLRAPAQMEPFETVFGALRRGVKVGSKRYGLMLDVAEGSDVQMMKALIKKWGIVAPAMALSYQWLDYKARNASVLDNTIFSEGITAGLATAWTKTNLAYHKAADVVGWTEYGKYQEEVAPGSTSLARLSAFPIMGALGGAGLYFGYKTGLAAKYQFMGQRMMYHAGAEGPDKFISFAKAQELGLAEKFTAQEELFGKVVRKLDANAAVSEAEEVAKLFRGENWFAKGGKWLVEKAGKKHYPFLGEIGPSKLAGLIGAGIGLLPIFPYLLGALAPKHTAEELQELYEGKRDVPIRKGRFWELGRSEYRGGQIDRWRPHWYRRLLDRSKEKAIWGPLEEERGRELSPFEKWRIKETTYELERAHYYDYPAPQSATFGEDIPFIGPLVAGTIGKLIKPSRLMHTEEWLRAAPGEGAEKSRLDVANINRVQVLHSPPGMGERRAPELGEVPPGIPISPYGFKGIVGEQFYRFTEQIGLPGFMLTAIKERLTGTPDLFDQEMQLETSRRAFGCLTDKVLVPVLNKGSVAINNVLPGDIVTTHNGNHVPVIKVIRKRGNVVPGHGSTKLLYAAGNPVPLECTPDHLIFTDSGWKEASKITTSDYLLIPKRGFSGQLNYLDLGPLVSKERGHITQKYIYPKASREFAEAYELYEETGDFYSIKDSSIRGRVKKSIKKGNIFRYRRHIPVDRLFGLFIGLFLAEGNITYQANGDISGIKLTLHKKEREWAEGICQSVRPISHNITFEIRPKHPNTLNIYISGRILGEILKGITGEKDQKHIPSFCYKAKKSFGYGVAEALILGDGCVAKNENRITFASTRRDLAYGFRDLIFALGFGNLGIRFRPKSSKYNRNNKLCYLLDATGETSRALRETFSWPNISKSISKNHRWFQDSRYLYIKVLKIGFGTAEDFYDLVLEHNDHSFLTDTCVVHNSEREYWDKELGGGFGLTEAYRRLIPHRRRQIPQYNPIENTMPSWIPSTGDRSIDFRHGIPFSKIPEGEMRLPGPGYAARHPYLEDVDPEDYPLIERFRILADLAKFSSKFDETLEQVRGARRAGLFSDEEEAIYKRTMEQLKASKKRKEFFDYQYRDKERTMEEERWRGASTRVEKPPHRNIFEKTFGGFWETLAHNAETPLEYLTPISPASKLVHMRTALEDYTKEQVWGTPSAFWQHPWRDFLRPFAESVKPDVGEPDIPKHIQRRRDLEEYFDILKYLKAARLKRMAQKHGDTEAAKEFESMSRETLAGIDPYAFDFSHIFRALPRRERDYFSEFVKAGLDEREEILDLVPENERKLYEARWQLKDASDKTKAVKRDLLTEDEKEKALDEITDTWREARLEGMPTSQDLWKEYLATRLKGETYADWYRRTRLIEKRLEGLSLPGPDFVGFHPSVDLEDIKMKVVENLGESYHDYDLWPSRLQSLAHKPYINKEAVDDIMNSDEGLDRTEIRRRIVDLFTDLDIKNMDISVVQGGIMQEGNEIDIEMLEDRDDEIREMGRRGELDE